MMNMKKLIALLLAMAMMLCFCACDSTEETETEPTETINEVTEEPTVEPIEEPTEEAIEEQSEPTGTLYRATVVDEGGNPIAGAMIQICSDTCYPGVTNAEGYVEWDVAEADYKVSFLSMPAGYDYSTEEHDFYFDAGSTELTITLKAVA